MTRARTAFVCGACGYSSPKWHGRCPECQAWDSMSETQTAPRTPAPGPGRAPRPVTLDQVRPESGNRFSTGLAELDRVLGGGLVPGSVSLLAGEPGIGKSTLVLQAADALARSGRRPLYLSGEESPGQLRLRAERLGLDLKGLAVVAETSLEAALALAEEPWDLLAVDSVQSLSGGMSPAPAGSLTQIRETAGRLIQMAKSLGRPIWLVGHVTKDGQVAGPKVLEHMVDTVLYFEGERTHNLRLLRSFKNRFGSVNEIGVFEMKDRGLVEVTNPSALFLAERPHLAPGSVVAPTLEGTRPLLVEVQALVSASGLAMPRRQALGIDPARLALLVAVLEKKLGCRLFDRDVFVNVAGGVRVVEPAADLALAAALLSSYHDRPVDERVVFVGEVGLAGEIRGVSRLEARLREAEKLGFERAVLPEADRRRLGSGAGVDLVGVGSVADLNQWLTGTKSKG